MTGHVMVRMYNVGFGDCFMLTLPGPDRARTLLIDCGRHSGTLTDEPPFWELVQQVVADLPVVDGHPFIDVLVVTHRHRDHVHGFSRGELWQDVRAGAVWMPWTENPSDPVATALRTRQDGAARHAFHALRALRARDPRTTEIALNAMTNEKAMTTIAGLGTAVYLPHARRTQSTVLRGDTDAPTGLPPGVQVHVLGPSRDPKTIAALEPPTGAAYLQLVPADPGTSDDPAAGPVTEIPAPWRGTWDHDFATYVAILQEAGQRRGEARKVEQLVADLDKDVMRSVEFMAQDDADNLAFAVDKVLNGTSLVLLFEIGDLCLLFSGDAQWGTWKAILANDEWRSMLERVRFVKVGHHGSHNATPKEFVEDVLTDAVAMISVSPTVYQAKGWKEIPKDELLAAMTEPGRVRLLVRSDELPVGDERVETDGRGWWSQVTLAVDAP